MQQIRAWRQKHARAIVQELIDFVSVPNNVYIPEQIQANARVLQTMLERRGVRVEQWPMEGGRVAVFGELPGPGAGAPTVLIYGHYDGVPVEPEHWHSDPYVPVLRKVGHDGRLTDWSTIPVPDDGEFGYGWRLFGRSVADSKNAIVAILAALDAIAATGRAPGVNVKFLFDGAEEIESPGLSALIASHADRLKADCVISASGETYQDGLPTVEFGVRGILMFELTVYTTAVEMHSGHFGNFAPNAAIRLAELLMLLKGPDGKVAVEGFYDDVVPLSPMEREAIQAIRPLEDVLQNEFGIARPEVDGHLLQELVNMPTLNVRGMRSGFVGEEARNIVPRMAVADFDARLVKGMDPDRTFGRILAHLERHGWTVLDHEPSLLELRMHERVVKAVKRAGFPATRTAMDSPTAQGVLRAMQRAVRHLVVMPSEGGSLPMHLFGMEFIGLPTSNSDCNQHTHDENLMLGFLFRGIDQFASLLLGNW